MPLACQSEFDCADKRAAVGDHSLTTSAVQSESETSSLSGEFHCLGTRLPTKNEQNKVLVTFWFCESQGRFVNSKDLY